MALHLAYFLNLKGEGNLNLVASVKMTGRHEKEKLQWGTEGRKIIQSNCC